MITLDTETQAVLLRLESDLFDIMNATIDGTLQKMDIQWSEDAACCVVMASGGYPLQYEKGKEISGLEHVKNSVVFHAGTAKKDGKIVTAGGRVLGVTAVAKTLEEATSRVFYSHLYVVLLHRDAELMAPQADCRAISFSFCRPAICRCSKRLRLPR